jgi:hypothetical protein
MIHRLVVIAFVALPLVAGCSDDGGTEADASGPPAVGDHWHAAYGVSVCGEFEPVFASENDPVGIHSHADGVIHIHPFGAEASGGNATLGKFFEAMGAGLSDESLQLGELGTFTEGEDDCDGQPAIVQVAKWADADTAESTEPQIITEDLTSIHFDNDREAYTIAFAPEGADIPPPPTIPQLDQLTDV